MAGIYGYIINTDNPQYFARIIARNEDLDAALRDAGYDPNSINVIQNPLVGASECASVRVLVHPRSDEGLIQAFTQAVDSAGKWELRLSEPNAPEVVSQVDEPASPAWLNQPNITIINNPGIPLPFRDEEGSQNTLNANGDAPPTDTESNFAAQSGQFQSHAPTARAFRKSDLQGVAPMNSEVLSLANAPSVQFLDGEPRTMHYAGLICTSVRELRRSAAFVSAVNPRGRPRNDDALFVLDFVDARYQMKSIRSMMYSFDLIHDGITSPGKISDSVGLNYIGGMGKACVNMLADPPVAFEATTVSATVTYPCACLDFSGFENAAYRNSKEIAPSWRAHLSGQGRKWTNAAASPTHIQQPYSRDEIISAFSQQVAMATNGAVLLDLEYYNTQLRERDANVFDDGDIINLDFRGMNLGEALDTFAQRLGCVWLWDRSSCSLMLTLARAEGTATAGSVPSLSEWLGNMERFRSAGYINTWTLDLPQTVLLSHEAHYCSRLGPERSGAYGIPWIAPYGYGSSDVAYTYAHLVDSRSHESNDGVISTTFTNGLNGLTPTLWHSSVPTPSHITVEVRDHIPAMVGHNTSNGFVPVFLPGTNSSAATGGSFQNAGEYILASGGPKGLGNTNTRLDQYLAPDFDSVDYEAPWNYSSGLLRTSVRLLNVAAIETTPTEESAVFELTGASRFDTTLKQRREIIQARMTALRQVADGDAVFARMPYHRMGGKARQLSPSVGLQYETVRFGTPGIPAVEYRISGKNTHPTLYPQGATVEKTTSGPGVGASLVSGIKHFSIRRSLRTNIVRTFMARVIGVQRVFTEDPSGAGEQKAYFHKYFFVEAAPDANPFTMYWSSGSALGFKGLCSGIAFNLYEQWFTLDTSSAGLLNYPHSVGGMPLNFDFGPNDSEAIRKPYEPVVQIAPVYEVTNRLGFTSYWIAIQPDIEVICPPNPSGAMPNPLAPWPYMGASGAARPNDSDLASIIENA